MAIARRRIELVAPESTRKPFGYPGISSNRVAGGWFLEPWFTTSARVPISRFQSAPGTRSSSPARSMRERNSRRSACGLSYSLYSLGLARSFIGAFLIGFHCCARDQAQPGLQVQLKFRGTGMPCGLCGQTGPDMNPAVRLQGGAGNVNAVKVSLASLVAT